MKDPTKTTPHFLVLGAMLSLLTTLVLVTPSCAAPQLQAKYSPEHETWLSIQKWGEGPTPSVAGALIHLDSPDVVQSERVTSIRKMALGLQALSMGSWGSAHDYFNDITDSVIRAALEDAIAKVEPEGIALGAIDGGI